MASKIKAVLLKIPPVLAESSGRWWSWSSCRRGRRGQVLYHRLPCGRYIRPQLLQQLLLKPSRLPKPRPKTLQTKTSHNGPKQTCPKSLNVTEHPLTITAETTEQHQQNCRTCSSRSSPSPVIEPMTLETAPMSGPPEALVAETFHNAGNEASGLHHENSDDHSYKCINYFNYKQQRWRQRNKYGNKQQRHEQEKTTSMTARILAIVLVVTLAMVIALEQPYRICWHCAILCGSF